MVKDGKSREVGRFGGGGGKSSQDRLPGIWLKFGRRTSPSHPTAFSNCILSVYLPSALCLVLAHVHAHTRALLVAPKSG